MLERTFINYFKSNQPYRFLGKSVRNVFYPSTDDLNVRNTINIEVSSICDIGCLFCIYRLGYRKKAMMVTKDFDKIARSAVYLGYDNLDLTPPSGEFFLNKNAVEIIKVAKASGFKHIGTYTNGISLHNHNLDELLRSGIDVIIISFPGFGGSYYQEICQADKFGEFSESITLLLEVHKRLYSRVMIIFEPRTYLSIGQIKQSELYCKCISKYVSDIIFVREPLRVFDSWCGEIQEKDLVKGMKVDVNPIKSIYPLKNSYPCLRIFMIGVLVNGDVRLCNCRYDRTIGTEKDPLFVGNIYKYKNLEELLKENDDKIQKIRSGFRKDNMPVVCKKCPFYRPVRYS
jgi:MoaA/NifB/PqqE/SkfB family radical SAM enzyme